jgi:hypothetical protein
LDPSTPVTFFTVVVVESEVIFRTPFVVADEYLLVAPNTAVVV